MRESGAGNFCRGFGWWRCFGFDAQVNARTLGERELLKWAEGPIAVDGIDMADHKKIVTRQDAGLEGFCNHFNCSTEL